MLSKKLETALNKQLAMEAAASQSYLAMACWADDQSLEGCAEFMFRQSDEERDHKLKLVHFILDSGGKAKTPAIPQPTLNFKSIIDMFEKAYKNEKAVSASIDALVDLANKEKDYQTYNFLQWYVEEQHEEEVLFSRILDRMKLIGLEGQGLYFIDEMIKTIDTGEDKEVE